MENATIPPQMNFADPNPHILFDEWKLSVATHETPWILPSDGPRRASINSFGYGGTNAHAIIEQAVVPNFGDSANDKGESKIEGQIQRPYLIPLASHSPDAGTRFASDLLHYTSEKANISIRDLAHSLSSRTSTQRYRCSMIGNNMEDITDQMVNIQAADAWKDATIENPLVRVGFVFTGQGAQAFDMGRQLLEHSPLFKETLAKCDVVLQQLPDRPDWSIIAELQRSEADSRLSQSLFAQPICTALQIALVDQLRDWGIVPEAVCGHSSGEIGAAYAAGILSLESAVVTAYYRGLHMGRGKAESSTPGSMLAVGISKNEADARLKEYQGRISIAAVNSPSSVTLSGDSDAIEHLKGQLLRDKLFVRLLKVEQAFHSHHMVPLARKYEESLDQCEAFRSQEPNCRMFSSVTARKAGAGLVMNSSYWAENMVKPVRFFDALVGTVLDETDSQLLDVLIEIGPHPVLKSPAEEVLRTLKVKIPYIGSLERDVPAFEALLKCAGQLWAAGYPVNLANVNQDYSIDETGTRHVLNHRELKDVPRHAWNHKKHWSMTRLVKEYLERPSRHSLLGALVPGSSHCEPSWRNYIRLEEIPWLRDHCIDGDAIFPAAGFCCMAIEALTRSKPGSSAISAIRLKDIVISAPLVLREDDDRGVEVYFQLRPVLESTRTVSDEWHDFTVFSYDRAGRETQHCRGVIAMDLGRPKGLDSIEKIPSTDELNKRATMNVGAKEFYSRLDRINLHYGKAFALLTDDIACGPGYAITSFDFDPTTYSTHERLERTILHPTLLDAMFHVIFGAIETILGRHLTDAFVSTGIGKLNLSGRLVEQAGSTNMRRYTVQAHSELQNQRTAVSKLFLLDQDTGDLIVEAIDNEVTALGTDKSTSSARSLFFRQRWEPSFSHLSADTLPPQYHSVGSLVRLFANQYPTSKILLRISEPEVVRAILEYLHHETGRPFFQTLQVLEYRNSNDGEFPGVQYVSEASGVYDLIVLDKSATSKPVTNIEGAVTKTGVIITNDLGSVGESFRCEASLSNCGWSVFRRARPSFDLPSVTVVLPTNTSSYTTDVISELRQFVSKGTFETTTLQRLGREELKTRFVIVLSSLDDRLCSDTWPGARRILTEESLNVVWALRGATMAVKDSQHAQVLGLLRTTRNENNESRFVSLNLDETTPTSLAAKRIAQALDPENSEEDFADRQGCLYIPRIEEDVHLNRKLPNGICKDPRAERFGDHSALSLRIGQVGLLETLHFAPDEPGDLPADHVEIQVKASALNFHDVAVALGIIQDHQMGSECAGYITRIGAHVDNHALKVGDRVIACRPDKCGHATFVHQAASLCFKIPDCISFATAGSISIVLNTAYYSLYDVARLQRGETVLIHSAAGGVGQVAIQLAQRIGARVLATCSESKRDILREQYGLKDSEIFSSRDDSFARRVLEATDGQGVDVALNSLAGKLLHATWSCIRPFGRFIEIGKRDIHQNTNLAMRPFRNNVTFSSVDLTLLYDLRPDHARKLATEALDLFFAGDIKAPSGIHEFPYSQVDKAFRLMQLGKHTGKIVLIPDENDMVPVVPATYQNKALFDPNKTYLLVGGLGGLGTITAEWMYSRGARSFAFMSGSGASKPQARKTVDWMRSRTAKVAIFQGDVGVLSDVERVVGTIGPSLAGIFHLAVTLEDAMVRSLSFEQLQAVVKTKVTGAWNLHTATLLLELDFFVCWSSVSAICGNKGQAAYVAACAHMDAFVRWRRDQGLVGTAMNLGAVPGRGLIAESSLIRQSLERNKLDVLTEQELLFLIEEAVTLKKPASSHGVLDWHQLIAGINLQQPDVWWADRSVFRTLYANREYGSGTAHNRDRQSLSEKLTSESSLEGKTEIFLKAFLDKIASVLGTPVETIQPSDPLSFYGLDSIVAVEFRRWVRQAANVDISLFDILGAKSILSLVAKIVSMLPLANSLSDQGAADNESHGKAIDAETKVAENLGAQASVIPKLAKDETVPMSTFQTRMYQLRKSPDDNWTLNLINTFRIKGNPDTDDLRLARDELVQRQGALRMAYLEDNQGLVQKPLISSMQRLEVQDFSSSDSPADELRLLVNEIRHKALAVEVGELMSLTLVKTSDDESYIIFNAHHICFDRGSVTVFMKSWMELYDAIVCRRGLESIPVPKTSYADFTLWHNARLVSAETKEHYKFWKSYLDGVPQQSTLLPFAKGDRPTELPPARGLIKRQLERNRFSRLKRICSHLNVTPFHFLLACVRAFILRHTRDEDFVVIVVDGGRPHGDLEDVIGCFANLLPVRFRNSNNDADFEELVLSTAGNALEVLSHSAVSFDGIADMVSSHPRPRAGYLPVGQIAVNYQMYGSFARYRTADFELTTEEMTNIPNPCELSFELAEGADSVLDLRIEFSPELYEAGDMARFVDDFVAFLASLISDHRQPMAEVLGSSALRAHE